MRSIQSIFYFFILLISCNSSTDKPYKLLRLYSGLNLKSDNLSVLRFSEQTSGYINQEGSIIGIFNIYGLNIDSLGEESRKVGYKKMPIKDIDLGGGFYNNINEADSGYYKLKLKHRSEIAELVILNTTQRKIILYKNW